MQASAKDLVKFGKSPVHAWGLFANALIPKGAFIIEYVGETIRSSLEDIREGEYAKAGVHSTYLFRMDKDTVIDATTSVSLSLTFTDSLHPVVQQTSLHVRLVSAPMTDLAISRSRLHESYLLGLLASGTDMTGYLNSGSLSPRLIRFDDRLYRLLPTIISLAYCLSRQQSNFARGQLPMGANNLRGMLSWVLYTRIPHEIRLL